MKGYTKLFASILDSSVWSLSKEARLLWITMLVKKDRDQVVRAAVPGLAHAARITLQEAEAGLKELMKPDPYSRSKDFDGRRLEEVSGGWLVLNGEKYRDMLSQEERREYQRVKQAQYRAEKRGGLKAKSVPLPGEKEFERAVASGDKGLEARTMHNHVTAVSDKLSEYAQRQAKERQEKEEQIAMEAKEKNKSEANSEAGPGES